jgi:UDP-N-acetylglucosamine 2-epimerase (non-hydrolysing)
LSPSSEVLLVYGTRPELIKLAPIARLLRGRARSVHTGQHYDPALYAEIAATVGMAEPETVLDVGGLSRGRQIAAALDGLDTVIAERRPAAVVVQGDTNAVLAGGLAANARSVPVVHVEAGLRSHDRRMPEEHNRILVDHLADLCLAPTEVSRANLLAEGIPEERIVVTGNTVVEAVASHLPSAEARARLLAELGLAPDGFVLVTLHRPENVDDPEVYRTILEQLAALDLPVVLPMHPRSRERLDRFGLSEVAAALRVIEPLDYPDFLGAGKEAALLISDSGGVQEEVSVLKRPVVVVRRSTERPEVLGSFADLVEPGPAIGKAARKWLSADRSALEQLPSPYGDGTAAERSVAAIDDLIERTSGLEA